MCILPWNDLNCEMEMLALKQRTCSVSIIEHTQTLNAITKGKRNLNTSLAMKIEEELNLEEGSLAILQTYYDIRKEKEKQVQETPDLSKLRKALFWDTDFNKINWKEKDKAVIKRVFERGNEMEKEEITRFYGKDKVEAALREDTRKPYSVSFKK